MTLGPALTQAVTAVLPMFGFSVVLTLEESLASLSSGAEVNVLLGFSGGMRGSLVLGCSQLLAREIVSRMMGGATVLELDEMGRSALAELANMLGGSALGYVDTDTAIELSPPTLITGQRLHLLISQVVSTRLVYSLEEEQLTLSYCTE